MNHDTHDPYILQLIFKLLVNRMQHQEKKFIAKKERIRVAFSIDFLAHLKIERRGRRPYSI